ncbi:NUDIX hydrolase [Sulfuracidifex tepidarius]|uniref:ADP-ribose pyrophosphatase n=1 Tax=Sulfuracidifex tepidarius TaxID=1294262 RepID=A0A510E7E5_9CREN|nr:NUDIX hydrolase [Sulfuracidifex tepidarius]BBG28170.1 ADP-ribose pyrophosphatase [Sulfuracidifex tepidarius]
MDRPLVAVGGLIMKDGKVLLVKRGKPPNAGTWAIPGGKVEYGETLQEALKREITEETGLLVEPGKVVALVQIIKEGFHYVIFDFSCEIVGGNLEASSDAKDSRFFSLEEIRRLETTPSTIEMIERYAKKEKIPLFILDRDLQK